MSVTFIGLSMTAVSGDTSSAILKADQKGSAIAGTAPSGEKSAFREWLAQPENRDRFSRLIDVRGHRELESIQRKIMSSARIDSRELLLFQVRVSQFAMRVELLSKVGESANSTVKRFQNGQ